MRKLHKNPVTLRSWLIFCFIVVNLVYDSTSLGLKYHRWRKTLHKRDDTSGKDLTSNAIPGSGVLAEADASGRYVGAFNHDCTVSVFISPQHMKAKFESDSSIIEQKDARCHWIIFGTEHCLPILTCSKFKLEPNPNPDEPCSAEYLEVTDGSGGLQRFCGGNGPVNVTTGKYLRDLYINFQGVNYTSKVRNRGFKCGVTCASPHEIADKPDFKILEENYEPEKSELCTCGRKPPGNRIVGGEDTPRGEFPWIVALVTSGTRRPYCGATIINQYFVLTAAHCFKGPYQDRNNFQVLGNSRLLDLTSSSSINKSEILTKLSTDEMLRKDGEDLTIRMDVQEYFIHPLYVRQTNDYDVALIKLKTPIDFHTYTSIQPACMPNLATYNTTYEGSQATVAGWGLNAANASSTMQILQKLEVSVLNNTICKSRFEERFSRRMLCAGFLEGGKDACKGDSGGPLIGLKSPQLWQIIGTVSWGDECAKKDAPGVYTRISEVNQWIRYISNMEDGVWCRE